MVSAFIVALVFSFIGSIPPGAINISVIQLAMQEKWGGAMKFSAASALVEFPYVIIAISFSEWLLSSELIIRNIKLIALIVMFTLSIINFWSYYKSRGHSNLPDTKNKGFRKGVVVSVFNPLAIPFWIGVTAYVTNVGWVSLNGWAFNLIYAFGVSTGTFLLLALLIILIKKFNFKFQNHGAAKLIPAIIFLTLGFYALAQLYL